MREIGSEFWQGATIVSTNIKNNASCFLLSGRTALYYIICDIQTERMIKSAYLPSYCCESMIEPFSRNKIKVLFYQVDSDGIAFNDSLEYDVILLLDYFGYGTPITTEIAKRAHNAGKIVIYDSTHKLNGNPDVEAYSDYSFISYRKWFYCNYAMVEKYNGDFVVQQPERVNQSYIETRESAAALKADYIYCGNIDLKPEFLKLYSDAEDNLDKDYVGYVGQPVEIDIDAIIATRRRNAEFLLSALTNIPEIQLWRDSLHKNDAPLFVPILVNPAVRNNLIRYLVEHDIYCPVHWPTKNDLNNNADIYFKELSLICDQRYTLDDMKREAMTVREFFHSPQL